LENGDRQLGILGSGWRDIVVFLSDSERYARCNKSSEIFLGFGVKRDTLLFCAKAEIASAQNIAFSYKSFSFEVMPTFA
jgi:hypothetical protein